MLVNLKKTLRFLLVTACILCTGNCAAQYKINLTVNDPAKKKQIYLAGNFNNWNSGDVKYILKPLDDTHKEITIGPLQKGRYEFKLTRGTWSTVQSTAEGTDVDNYVIELTHDTAISVTIAGWVDDYSDISKFPDSIRLNLFIARGFKFMANNLDSSYKYAVEANHLAKKLGNTHREAFSFNFLGNILMQQGNTAKALEAFLQSTKVAGPNKDTPAIMTAYIGMGDIFYQQNDQTKAKYYYLQVTKAKPQPGNEEYGLVRAFQKLGRIYLADGKLDSAIYCGQMAYNDVNGVDLGEAALLLGDVYKQKKDTKLSFKYYHDAVNAGINFNNLNNIADGYQRIAQEFKESNNIDSGLYYSRKAFKAAQQINTPPALVNAGTLLVEFFKTKSQLDSAFIYLQIVLQAKENLSAAENDKRIQRLLFDQQLQQQKESEADARYQSRIKIYALIGGVVVLLLFALFLYRSNKHKQKANSLLTRQKHEIEKTLEELKTTQKQLIQSEKMASLGELTAGIAHEIQNPLNFVNNFSEVSKELLDELQDERNKAESERDKELEENIIKDIVQNLEKINLHGKRADAIVKGMLQHSRKSEGKKEPVDINALTDEYLRLSYHGLRAKDKLFNATLHTVFDETIGKVNIISQDIGRVVLNILTNAFYAVNEKSKIRIDNYQPTVSVQTKKSKDKVHIIISDNGNGIPQQVIDKIFQPFFTTKPAGQGTGLGLSLSYDIIKAHGGEIKVETKEGEGTTFTIMLPL